MVWEGVLNERKEGITRAGGQAQEEGLRDKYVNLNQVTKCPFVIAIALPEPRSCTSRFIILFYYKMPGHYMFCLIHYKI